MRKLMNWLMVLLLIATVLTGIAEASPNHTGSPVAHIAVSVIFVALIGIHMLLRRKALFGHLLSSWK